MTNLKVDADVLHSAGASFGQVADDLRSLQADAQLGDADANVPSLQTGAACLAAQSDVAAATTEVADGARRRSNREDRDPEVAGLVAGATTGGHHGFTCSVNRSVSAIDGGLAERTM